MSLLRGELKGKLALITGASRGIGAAIAENLAAKGCSLILNYTSDTSREKALGLQKELERAHETNSVCIQADVGAAEGAGQIVSAAKEHFKHPEGAKFQIDIVINNAGVSHNATIEEITAESFEWQYRINVLGPLWIIQAVLPYLPQDRSGRIVNVSSISSTGGFVGQSIYGGTKAALESMTRTWARELSERATVNAINPGPVKTDMWGGVSSGFRQRMRPFVQQAPLEAIRPDTDDQDLVEGSDDLGGRPAYPKEIAGIVGMLCTLDSAWCTGQVICANGGMRMSI